MNPLRLPSLLAVALALCAFFPSYALAWHKTGHMEAALAAYDQLKKDKPELCDKLVGILRQHPRFADDFQALIPDGLTADQQGQWIFCLAAEWPDAVRPAPGRGNAPPKIPADPAAKTSYHRPQWHFINFPYAIPADQEDALETAAKANLNLGTSEPAQEDLNFNAIQALKFNTHVLATSDDVKAQAVAICWILHLIGDLHQPLHCVALFTPHLFAPTADKPQGDRGGNSIAWGTGEADNLHFVWDDVPGTNAHAKDYDAIRQATDHLLTDDNVVAAKTAEQQLDPVAWAQESMALAKKQAYTDPIKQEILTADQNPNPQPGKVLSSKPDGYEDAIRPIANQRVAEAGFRAAGWLMANPAK